MFVLRGRTEAEPRVPTSSGRALACLWTRRVLGGLWGGVLNGAR